MHNQIDKYLITCAFPYSNGSIHLGHLLEQIQADILVRYLRMKSHIVFFICSDDTHGTAVMLKSQKLKISSKFLIEKTLKKHKKIFKKFSIFHDNYSSTNSKFNKKFCEKIYKQLKKKKLLFKKKIFQWYDIELKIFLSDRFVKGTCPRCQSFDQFGDHCEKCGAFYYSGDLLNVRSVLSNTIPILKSSTHIFFNIKYFKNFLKKWIKKKVFQNSVLNKTKEWLFSGLKAWNISRDFPYFGFLIPGFSKKYFYVWFDAIIGYLSNFEELCFKNSEIIFSEFWNLHSKIILYQFIGKDIINFHTLFWPSILEAISYRKPTKIFAHGHITFQGRKLSKSRGIVLTAKKWLKFFDSDSLRYYYATKINNSIEDIEINLENFIYKINSDLVNRIVNLAARNASFLKKNFLNILSKKFIKLDIYLIFINSIPIIQNFYFKQKFCLVTQKIMELADLANQYISNEKPWKLSNSKKDLKKMHLIVSMGINLFRILITFLKPITPVLAKNAEKFLKIKLTFQNCKVPLLNHKIKNFFNLHNRLDLKILNSFFKNI